MKPVQLVLTVTFAFLALGATVWLGRYQGQIPVVDQSTTTKKATDPDELPVPAEGPFGKAVVEEAHFDFGVLEKGDSGSHVFLIKNEGPGPLRLKKGTTSCPQCTIGNVTPENEDIPPGGTGEVHINWKISSTSSKFRQTADVHTTDPDNRKLVFAIEGLIDSPLHLTPEGTWSLGDLSEAGPTRTEGLLYSTMVDDIAIERVESANPQVSVTWEPASAAHLSDKLAKSGYLIKVAIEPGSTIGPLRENIKLHTNVRGGTVVEFMLSGRRPGPIEVKGRGFIEENNVAKLGEFPSAEGAKLKLKMYVRNLEGEMDAQQVATEDGRAIVRVAMPGKTFGKSKVYDVEVEVPAGPPNARTGKNAEPVVLKLNHPKINEFKMYVDYYAK